MGIRFSLWGLGGGRSGVGPWFYSLSLPSLSSTNLCVFESFPWRLPPSCLKASSQLSATDVSARTTMKGAAKCDKHCDLQNSVNQQGFERILRFRDIPESMPASVSTDIHAAHTFQSNLVLSCMRVCVSRSSSPLTHSVYRCCPQQAI